MSVTTFMARRYLQAGRSNRFFSWISALTIAGVAIGVAAMIVVWSVINGFEAELRRRFLAANAHIMAYRFPSGISEPDGLAQQIKDDFPKDVVGVAPFTYYETMARKDSVLHATLVKGTSPILRESVQSLRAITEPPEAMDLIQKEVDDAAAGKPLPDVPTVVVGSGLLSLLDAKVGDEVSLLDPKAGDTASAPMKAFKIRGVLDTGLKHYDNKQMVMSIPAAQRFFGMGRRVTGLEIGLKDPWTSTEVLPRMEEKYDLSLREWQSLNRPLFEAMQMERVVILLITALVAAVAGFNILTTIFVAVSQRQRDISVLKAIGATNRQILTLFVKQGAYVGVVGSVFGMGLAFGISKILQRYQFIDLPDLYLLARLPVSYDWWVYVGVSVVSLFIAVMAGLFPAALAARVDPVQGFRGNEGAG